MASKYVVQRESTVVAAVGDAYSSLSELRNEIEEVVYGASGTPREETSRIQTLQESVSSLDDADSEPDVPEFLQELKVTYTDHCGPKHSSRSWRRDNAVEMLRQVIDVLDAFRDGVIEKAKAERRELTADEGEKNDEAETLRDEIENSVDNFESAEFPGMFG
jgi:hypothetical protein